MTNFKKHLITSIVFILGLGLFILPMIFPDVVLYTMIGLCLAILVLSVVALYSMLYSVLWD